MPSLLEASSNKGYTMNIYGDKIETRARELGIEIPITPKPQGNYTPALVVDNLVFTSGMGPILHGIRHNLGYVGGDVTIEKASDSAEIAVLNALSALRSALESLDQIERIIRLTGYVRSAPGFGSQASVIDAASNLLVELFGEKGRHVRSAIGVAELPFGIPVEIELIAQIKNNE